MQTNQGITSPRSRHFAAITALFSAVYLLSAYRDRDLQPPSSEVALAGLDPRRPIGAVLETDLGHVRCFLDARHAPRAVALFVGLATGRAAWREPKTLRIVTRPLYQDLTFHRAIADVYVQSGCPVGDSSGHPGYRIELEPRPDDVTQLSTAGVLVLARYTPPPKRTDPNPPPEGHVLGSQFGITLVNMHHLAGQVSVLGHCEDLDVVREISHRVGRGRQVVTLRRIRIE